MRILLFSDLHSSKDALDWLKTFLSETKIDLIISPGDIVDRHEPDGEQYVNDFNDICRQFQVPLKVVFGNNEPQEVISLYERKGISLHNQSFELSGYTFVGIGDIEVHLDRIVDPAQLPIAGNILVTHRPPQNNSQFSVPSPAKAVEGWRAGSFQFKNMPAVHIAGHLHSEGFVKKLGKTLVVNVPAALNGGAAILQLPEKSVQFIKEHD